MGVGYRILPQEQGGGIPPSHTGVTVLPHSSGGLPGHNCVSGNLCISWSLNIVKQGTRDSYISRIFSNLEAKGVYVGYLINKQCYCMK